MELFGWAARNAVCSKCIASRLAICGSPAAHDSTETRVNLLKTAETIQKRINFRVLPGGHEIALLRGLAGVVWRSASSNNAKGEL